MYLWNPDHNEYKLEQLDTERFRLSRKGSVLVEDGTYAETKERIAGEMRVRATLQKQYGGLVAVIAFIGLMIVLLVQSQGIAAGIAFWMIYAMIKSMREYNRLQMLEYVEADLRGKVRDRT